MARERTTDRGSGERLADAVHQFAGATADASVRAPEGVETYGESLQAVGQVSVVESGEPLIDLRSLQPPLAFARAHPWGAVYRRHFFVRQTVAQMLAEAQRLLPSPYRLLIIEGYRPAIFQRRLFQGLYGYLACLYPEWGEGQLREAANVLIADPDSAAPPPHSTGGAVDLTLADGAGKPLDMTSPLGWTAAAAPTDCSLIEAEARANGRILSDALSAAGLTNYPGEWWHWSYGEPGWAVRTGQSAAIYGPLAGPYAEPASGSPDSQLSSTIAASIA